MKFNPKMIGLLTKYGSRKLSSLAADDLTIIAEVLGVDVGEDGVNTALDLLRTEEDVSIGTWIANEGNLAKLTALVSKPKAQTDSVAVKCPHCGSLFELHFENNN